ncbi:ATPase [Sphingobium nicotianae]|uniref:ATP synthase subunit b n=1 Tax=Sphingobium nicotianae TaxID=2782607 RepID=A0A9X1AJJ0_9SPHN|nr:ATPase [Sphingobium nicotianae]MBT2185836.1 ATPase [Sphingobium nicotianae]
MPQIAQLAATYSSQIFWMLLTFGFVFFVIGLGMVPKVQSTVDARDRKIADDLDAAKAGSAAADALEADWRAKENEARAQAQAKLAEAKAKGAKDREAKLAKADAAIGEKLAAAEAVIETGRSKALGEIEAVAAEAAADIVRRLAGAEVSSDAALQAVKAVL